nr:phage protein NinX family protein [Pseudomonas luteola]
MEMVEKKTEELTGAALDWAVAKALDWKEPIYSVGPIRYSDGFLEMTYPDPDECIDDPKLHHFDHGEQWAPSRIWSQAGPLIEKNSITIYAPHHMRYKALGWGASRYRVNFPDMIRGETALIAACRKVVQLHLGDTVQIPSELA